MASPGRMFNSAPLDFDPFYVEHHVQRRKLQQVASYHDLDDIPTMATSHPDTMGSGGCVVNKSDNKKVSSSEMSSPNCVTDVKHFDPTAFHQDDNAGVSIDLCLSETDESTEEDDLFVGLYDEEEDDSLLQSETSIPDELQTCLRHPAASSTTSTTSTTTIQDRRVTFAAQHVVLRVEDELDAAFPTDEHRYVHQVFDAVQVWFIPHHTDYSDCVRASLWYNPAEMAFMKERAHEFRRSQRKRTRVQRAVQQQRFEAELDTCALFGPSTFVHPPTTKQPLSNEIEEEEDIEDYAELSRSERRNIYEAMVDAVLLEQFEQRRQCLRIHGRIEEGCSGILDAHRIAEVCANAGDTLRSQERAFRRARDVLEEEQDQEVDEIRDSRHSQHSLALAPAPLRGSKKPTMPHQSKRTSASFHSSALQVETSQLVDQGIASLFSTLLSPFLEIRQGDLFLGVGEEMSVTGC